MSDLQRNNPAFYGQRNQETESDIVYGSMSSETWRKQQFAAQAALEKVQRQEDEDAEFMMLEQVSKDNVVSFGIKPDHFGKSLSPRQMQSNNQIYGSQSYDTRDAQKLTKQQTSPTSRKRAPMFYKNFDEDDEQADDEDYKF